MVCFWYIIVSTLHKGDNKDDDDDDDDDDNNNNNNSVTVAYGKQKWDDVGRNELGWVFLNKSYNDTK